jgi:hypothetical protein
MSACMIKQRPGSLDLSAFYNPPSPSHYPTSSQLVATAKHRGDSPNLTVKITDLALTVTATQIPWPQQENQFAMRHSCDNETTKLAPCFGSSCSASLEQCPSLSRIHTSFHHPSLQSRGLVGVATAAILAAVCIEGVLVEQLPKCLRRQGVVQLAGLAA